MGLIQEYERQFAWRDWPGIFAALPDVCGKTVIDLGCGIGGQAVELVRRGARVVGFDLNPECVTVAQLRGLPNAVFQVMDLRSPPESPHSADGLWCAFTAAYFPDLPAALANWQKHVRPGGWIAITEIDDLFGHEPLCSRTKLLLEEYAHEALLAHRYDFHMGHKLAAYLEQSGFAIERNLTFADQELAFDGPAAPEVIAGWCMRFERMALLRKFCGAAFPLVRRDFAACLASPEHRSKAKVFCCVATKPMG